MTGQLLGSALRPREAPSPGPPGGKQSKAIRTRDPDPKPGQARPRSHAWLPTGKGDSVPEGYPIPAQILT